MLNGRCWCFIVQGILLGGVDVAHTTVLIEDTTCDVKKIDYVNHC